MSKPFSIKSRIQSFIHALGGVRFMLNSQHNAWIHALATCVVCLSGLLFRYKKSEWCLIILAIIVVWTAEALNTAFEFLADVASPEYHPLVKKAKDVAAGAVLLSALGSVIIAVIIIGPHIWNLLRALL